MYRTTTTSLVNHPIEIPSWAFRGPDVRFSDAVAPGAPRTPYEVLADAAAVQRFTGVTPSVALHLPTDSTDDYSDLARHAAELRLTIGSVHPEVNLRHGRPPGVCHPDELIRARALAQLMDGLEVAAAVGARRVVLRFADDSPYPGHRELRARQERMAIALTSVYAQLPAGVRLVIEFAVVEPCFYTPDLPDWGTAYAQCLHLGPSAQVMVDTGTYAQGRDPEFVGDLLSRDGRLGGVVLRSPSDGTADPLDLFLVVSEIGQAVSSAEVPYTLDPGANTNPGVLPLLHSVLAIQQASAQASQLDVPAWHAAQADGDRQLAHRLLLDAYTADPTSVLVQARAELGIDPDPIGAYLTACQAELRTAERRATTQRMAARRRIGATDRLPDDWRPAPRRAVGSAAVAAHSALPYPAGVSPPPTSAAGVHPAPASPASDAGHASAGSSAVSS